MVMYQLLYNIHVILGKPDKLKEYDVRRAVYVKHISP